ncbi:hypothetical protein [Geminocystis sp. NIES-3709]|uniref:DUF7219 family protein n=1 Tax=Geminocystis sp. NIES-3709 TaxID=1617448 RepID=UPI0005FC6E16|nr:hypothetical protein [Geminocystis sp. NIES-3709]BAQ64904.1 isopropylmalate/homocitrate/citramalate synthases [Geminocystis sp. NIES-3709]
MVNTIVQEIKKDFLYPISPYHGQDYIKGLIPNQKLQKFTSQINYMVGLHTNGKLSTSQVCQKIEQLWEELEMISD